MVSAMAVLRRRYAPRARYAAPILLVLMAAVVVLLVANALSFRNNLDFSRAAASDNRVWATSQLEVDHKNLLLALDAARHIPLDDAKDRIAVAFDIYYSRVEILYAALKLAELPSSLRSDLEKAVQGRDALAVQFDNLDLDDPAALARLTADATLQSPLLRQIALESLGYFIDDANMAREREVMLWTRFLVNSLVLIVLMATAMCFALLLRRQLSDQIELVQSAANDTRMVYDATMMAVVVSDLDGKIVLFNAAAEKVYGCQASDIVGRNIAETMIPPHRLDSHFRAMKRLQDEGTDNWLTGKPKLTTTLDAKGREIPIELTILANRDTNGKTLLIAFIRDVSEQLAYERNLRAARDEARHHAESRTMFLATMSHEMRTPLHGLLASLDLIDEAGQSPEARRLLATARDCALRSVSQINDVLDLIQIDESQEPATAFAPAGVVAEIIAEQAAIARERGNRLQINVTGAAKEQLWSGAAKTFARVMYNLIGNALKFTENGSVQVDLRFQTDADGGHRLAVAVQDSGIGISAEDQARIFDLFVTSPSTGAGRRQDGTGLGLAIARKGVEKMGGHLSLESTLGAGSRFHFDIALAVPLASALPAETRPPVVRQLNFDLSCLVVDDNIVNLELTAQMLRQLGCKVLACDNGAAAVSATLQMQFDVIFMDLNMPGGMSGGEAARKIRSLEQADPQNRARSCIIALTADTTFGNPLEVAEQGMDRVLHKPVRTPDLVRMLDGLESRPDQFGITEQPAAGDASFDELFALMGPVAAKRLLVGVVDDLRAVQSSLSKDADPQLEDILHRATGSAGMVGLSDLSLTMSGAVRTLRQQGHLEDEVPSLFCACDLAIESIQLAMA